MEIVNDIDLGSLELIESNGTQLEMAEFEGKKVPIDTVDIVIVPTDYDEHGNLVKGLARKVKALCIKTKPVAEVTKNDGTKVDICGSEIVNLKEKDGKLGYSQSPNAKIQKLMKKVVAAEPKELIGKMVTIRTREKILPDGGSQTFLGFII